MTKYILHGGGGSSVSKDEYKKCWLEAVDGIEKPKILCVYFSREHEPWEHLFEQDKDNLARRQKGRGTDYTFYHKKDGSSDVIEMRGTEYLDYSEEVIFIGIKGYESCDTIPL